MPAWRDQAPENLAALANIVLGFSDVDEQITPTPAELTLGETVYKANCSECHGESGGGDGFAANDFPITPSDFRGERVSYAESVRILRNGVAGTSMAPWTDRLDDEEILAVAHYVQAILRGRQQRDRSSSVIAAIIVSLSLLFALVFTLAYFLRPGLRDQVERPKYAFQEQVRLYNQQNNKAGLKEHGHFG